MSDPEECQKENPILTIAIPTFNRSADLERQLKLLILQNSHEIEILISDNASSDNTYDVLKSLGSSLPNLLINRNQENIGFDRNLLWLYTKARSEYIWFLSDDDPLLPGAVECVLKTIRQEHPTVAVFGSTTENPPIRETNPELKSSQRYRSLREIADYTIFFKTIFLSGLVVKKNPTLQEDELKQLLGTNFFQVSLALVLLGKSFDFLDVQEIIIVQREVGYVTRLPIAELWFVSPARAMHLPQYGYDLKKLKRCFASRRPFLRFLAAAKAGLFSINPNVTEKTKKEMQVNLDNSVSRFVVLSLFLYRLLPAFPFRFAYALRCIMNQGFRDGMIVFRLRTQQFSSTKASGF